MKIVNTIVEKIKHVITKQKIINIINLLTEFKNYEISEYKYYLDTLPKYESFKNKIITLVSLLSGFFVIAASGTRAAWVLLLFLLVVYLYFSYKHLLFGMPLQMIISILLYLKIQISY